MPMSDQATDILKRVSQVRILAGGMQATGLIRPHERHGAELQPVTHSGGQGRARSTRRLISLGAKTLSGGPQNPVPRLV